MPSDFLIDFHKQHFSGTEVPIYSRETLTKLLEELEKVEGVRQDGIRES